MSVTINGTSGLVFNDASTQATAATGFGFKNRLINSAMVIDQRNAGASVTPLTSGNTYCVDRWTWGVTQASKLTVQQSSTSTSGFSKSLLVTSSSAYSVISTDIFGLIQRIEGFNVADLAWGTASAATVTLSFWVRSSLTGTFGASLQNGASNRSYPFTYTISSANTFEQKTITIVGDTTGTWVTDNTNAIQLTFSMGAGSNYNGTANAWSAGSYFSVTGATSVVGTNGATFYITGVQLEKGSTATSFDYRPYGTELQLCQRYYESSYDIGTAAAAATTTGLRLWSWAINGNNGGNGSVVFQVPKRTAPTVAIYDGAGNVNKVSYSTAAATPTYTNNIAQQAGPYNITTNGFIHAGQGAIGNVYNYAHFTATSEL
jgi:hypothetical protein